MAYKIWPVALAVLLVIGCNNSVSSGGSSRDVASHSQALDAGSSAITAKWTKLGGAAKIGKLTSGVKDTPGGRSQYQTFAHGVIVYSNDYGAVYLTQIIFDKWLSLQGQTNEYGADLYNYIGQPIQDYTSFGTHDDGTFERGVIVVEGTITHVVYGEIYSRYLDSKLAGILGLPSSEEASEGNGGRYQIFEHGEIHWHNRQGTGAFGIWGPILDRWKALGGVGGALGFPTSDVADIICPACPSSDQCDIKCPANTKLGLSDHFQGGAIFYSDATGAWEIKNDILASYEKQKFGGPVGWLGFPIGGEGTADSGDQFVDFQNGVLVYHVASDAYSNNGQDPVLAFGALNFTLERVAGYGGECDLYVNVRVDTSTTGRVVDARLPKDGNFGSADHTFTEGASWDLTKAANSSFTVHVEVNAMDSDSWYYLRGSDDDFGTAKADYSINNLWGFTEGIEHDGKGPDGTVKAWLNIGNNTPYDKNNFLGQLWWSFHNFETNNLTYDQFAQTFADVDVDQTKWHHPFNWLWYKIYNGLAAGGQCFGMSLESIYAQLGRSVYSEPIHRYFPDTQDNRELIKATLDDAHKSLINEINIKQGYQMGLDSVGWSMLMLQTGAMRNAMANDLASSNANNTGDYPLISIFTDDMFSNSHTVRPYKWTHLGSCDIGSSCERISIADPNHPVKDDGNIYDDTYMDIDSVGNKFQYYPDTTFNGTTLDGGLMFYQPFVLFNHQPVTPFAKPFEFLHDSILFVLGSMGKVNQVTDDAGRTFFKPGLSSPPTHWSDIQDDASRIPNFAPVMIATGAPLPGQIYAGQNISGATHTYEIVPTPGVAALTPYEAAFESATMSSAFTIPGTPGKPDRITAHKIGTDDKAMSVTVPPDGETKAISWTIAGYDKQRWTELTGLTFAPGQTITIRPQNAGYNMVIDNDGPPTQAAVRVQSGSGIAPVDIGVVDVPHGSSSVQFDSPDTTLTMSDQVPGHDDWLLAPVTVTLAGRDYSGTGIAAVEYSRDQVSWTPYTAPFVYADEGETTLYFRSRDNAMNQGQVKNQKFKIDSHAPTVTATLSVANGVARLSYSMEDATPGSGLAGFHALIPGQNPPDWFSQGNSGSFQVPLGCSAIEYWGEDAAGNQSPHIKTADTVPPVINAPPVVSSAHCSLEGEAGTTVDFGVTATDDCGGPVILANDAPTHFPVGITTVNWLAKDTAGNVSTAKQTVNVSLDGDASCCPSGNLFDYDVFGLVQWMSPIAIVSRLGPTSLDQIRNDPKLANDPYWIRAVHGLANDACVRMNQFYKAMTLENEMFLRRPEKRAVRYCQTCVWHGLGPKGVQGRPLR